MHHASVGWKATDVEVEGVMIKPSFRGAGFTPPVRSSQTLLRGLALPQLAMLFALALSIVVVVTAITLSVGTTERRQPAPITSNVHSLLL